MKLRLSILLLAATALAAPAAGQTIKSLGYNTTNGQVVYSGSNSLTFTNALQFSTNARAATRTNLGGTTVGNAVFTATNAAAAADAIGLGAANEVVFGRAQIGAGSFSTSSISGVDFAITAGRALTFISGGLPDTSRTNLGLGATNNVTFSNITANGILNANDSTATPATNAAAAQGIQWSGLGGSQHAAIYGGYAGAAQIALAVGASSNALSDVATFQSTGMTVASNAVVGGTLTATGNATLNGVNNIAPSQTTNSASSLMTRDLSDDRYTTYVWLTGSSDNQTITNGGFKFLGPSRINSFSLGYGASVPAGYTKFRVLLNFGWLTDPATNSSNFQVFVRFNNVASLNSNPIEAETGTVAGTSGLYPTNSLTNGLTGTFTRLGVINTTNSVYRFTSEYETIPAAWQSNAASNGFFHLIGVALRNNSGGSLTDGYNAGHAPVGIVEFRK